VRLDRTGTYALLLKTSHAVAVDVGALGPVDLEPGAFVYVGSAFGPGGLAARLRRHLQPEKASPHWHIDYLRAALVLEGAWISTDDDRHECAWAHVIAGRPSTQTPLPGAGASDCSCDSHFLRIADTSAEPTSEDQGREAGLLPCPPLTSAFDAQANSLSYVNSTDLRKHLTS